MNWGSASFSQRLRDLHGSAPNHDEITSNFNLDFVYGDSYYCCTSGKSWFPHPVIPEDKD
jgi:hypothetical protein